MTSGRVYLWIPDDSHPLGGYVRLSIVPLQRLTAFNDGNARLLGRHVYVRNGGEINEPGPDAGEVLSRPIGDARPDANSLFCYEPGIGGWRLDNHVIAPPELRNESIEASHFGEVNTYYHLDQIASYVHELLEELGAPSLPQVVAVVNAHHAATERSGVRDGLRREARWVAFQGGHYRLPSRRDVLEPLPISANGEIHLGPGRQYTEHGALPEAAGKRYRQNASHNAGIIYHEYGHHINRHTADFQANAMHRPDRQSNHKSALDEGVSDYWAATMLKTPHIWAWHRRHDSQDVHPRSLASHKTLADYEPVATADPHSNGTIVAAALWDMRTGFTQVASGGARLADRLVLKALLLIGAKAHGRARVRRMRGRFSGFLAALLLADRLLNASRYHEVITARFFKRGILTDQESPVDQNYVPVG